MRCEALKPFTCANDSTGIKSTDLGIGDKHNVPDELVEMLEKAGYVKRLAQEALPQPSAEAVPAPHPFDHDGDGRKGGSLPKSKRHKS